jgi:uncharacterized membrane-anchored protein YitT (DUF2179 family)
VNHTNNRHSLLEDAQALLTATLFISLGITLYKQTGLLTGGTAGLAFLVHYATGTGLGLLFFLINLPFYGLAWFAMGRAFTFKTFIAVALLACFTEALPRVLNIHHIHPLYAAVMGGLLIGAGFLMLFRHQSSLGGVGIVALWLQQRHGWRAGKVQMVVDCCIVLAAFFTVTPMQLVYSLVGAVVLNLTLAVNHKPGRYVAM